MDQRDIRKTKQKSWPISLYWTCQLLGWGSAVVYWSYYHIRDEYNFWIGVASLIWSFAIGIGSTHLYKLLAHRKGWTNLDIQRLVPVLFIALCALTAIYVVANYGSVMILMNLPVLDTGTFLGMLSGGIRYMAIWLLAFHLYHYAQHRKQIEIDQAKYEKLAIAAQFQQLNAELNPHFLFNSLNSIKALTLENPQAAREAIDLLSDMLRDALQLSDKRVIPLRDELQRVKAYLALEKIRFEERLHYSFYLDDNSLDIPIPPLSLYNLVENAVKHGINNSKSGGRIRISATIEEDRLQLVVVNDGKLLQKSTSGIGLKNVQKRIQLVFGQEARLEVNAISGEQVESRMSIPLV